MTSNIAASIKARLLTKARKRAEEFELFLVRYACERFLYRLGASRQRNQCTLKGAGLLTLWMDDPYRATRDLDFLASGANDEAAIRAAMETICRVPCPEDGLNFDLGSLVISPIRAEEEYPGQRAVLNAHLGTARIRLQVDFGFGDAVTPGPEESDYPTLIEGLPVPRVQTYPQVVTVAEKFEAMVHLGRRNSRMKDFHDIWALSGSFPFDGAVLCHAVAMCFERRRTAWTPEVPDALTPGFYSDSDLQSRWQAYFRAGGFRAPPPTSFEEIGEGVQGFFRPMRDSILADDPLGMFWPAGGPWLPQGRTEEHTP
ncbi:MAG: nucleotidyl transferase AbiEii/AbiGii toxin family protein [Spirochaetaceae bacterium]|nr:nucleotidyl transferase AbiEii/AbiGii toxin family protein [Spirochaetaceae bacterium]